MAAEAQRGIECDFAWLRIKNGQNLINTNRAMRAGRRLAAGDDFSNIVSEIFGIQFLVFFRELFRVRATVSLAAYVGWRGFGCHRSATKRLFALTIQRDEPPAINQQKIVGD